MRSRYDPGLYKNTWLGPCLQKNVGWLRVRFPWTPNWAAVVCCWKLDRQMRVLKANIIRCCACVSPLRLPSLLECLARGWTVTEPPLPTPSLVRWVVAALACESSWSWVVCGTRVRSYVCQTTLTVANRLEGAGCQNVFEAVGTSRSAPASNG